MIARWRQAVESIKRGCKATLESLQSFATATTSATQMNEERAAKNGAPDDCPMSIRCLS